ncbi:MAG: UDP-N-acetylmuramyl-tripeptide synthetase [Patescibacteria group bacterium]
MLYELKQNIRAFTPLFVIHFYHWFLAFVSALFLLFPSKRLIVIGVTGTKGKTSTTEFINAIFEAAGYTTALSNTIRMKVGPDSKQNTRRMSMPGRFTLQMFIAKAADAGCQVLVMEMTSEGARQHRHRFIDIDALVFTNLSPEHIESHGSFEAYANAKMDIGRALVRSPKRPRIMVANAEDAFGAQFLSLPVDMPAPFSLAQVTPYHADSNGGTFTFNNKKILVHLPGDFSLRNAVAAAVVAHAFGIQADVIARGIDQVTEIPGRAQEIKAGQDFSAVVDYAHTPDSLSALYDAYAPKRLICVLGNTGGGRDIWKRPKMGEVADTRCAEVILTNEDPYDEDPASILQSMASGMKRTPTVILDRRAAIREALHRANPGDAVLITGKGTDPSIRGAGGTSIPWSDAVVVAEELRAVVDGKRFMTTP